MDLCSTVFGCRNRDGTSISTDHCLRAPLGRPSPAGSGYATLSRRRLAQALGTAMIRTRFIDEWRFLAFRPMSAAVRDHAQAYQLFGLFFLSVFQPTASLRSVAAERRALGVAFICRNGIP